MPNIHRLKCIPEKVCGAAESKFPFVYGLISLLKPRKILIVTENEKQWSTFLDNQEIYCGEIVYVSASDTAMLEVEVNSVELSILDCETPHPGPLMCWLNTLPFLRDGAICVVRYTRTYAKNLFSSITADKLLSENLGEFGAFQITADSHKYIESVFLELTSEWEFMPDLRFLLHLDRIAKQYFPSACVNLVQKSVEIQKNFGHNTGFEMIDENGKFTGEDSEVSVYLKEYIEKNPLPEAYTVGEAMLSAVEGGDEIALREKLCGWEMQQCLDALRYTVNVNSGESWENLAIHLHGIFHTASLGGVYSNEVGIRTISVDSPDRYAAFCMMKVLCDVLFKDEKARLLFIRKLLIKKLGDGWLWFIKPLMQSVAAYMMLENGNINGALVLAVEARSGGDCLYTNDLFVKISEKARELGMRLFEEQDLYLEDMSDYFCTMPFELLMVAEYDFNINSGSYYLCQCSSWLPIRFNSDDPWNGEHFKRFRESILDGSFRYCNKARCPYILNKDNWWLQKKNDIKDPKLRDIIDNRRLRLDYSPKEIILGYDFHCNLKCASCRNDFRHLSKEELEQLNCYMRNTLLPLLKTARILKLSGQGEALSSPHSLELLRTLTPDEYPDIEIYLQTNGASVTKKKWESLGEARKNIKQIVVSIDGANKETFEKLRYPARWEKLLESMEFLKDLRKNGELRELHVNFVLQVDNYSQLWDMLGLCENWGVDIFMAQRVNNLGSFLADEYEKIDIANPLHPEHSKFVFELEQFKKRVTERKNGFDDVPKVTFVDF